MKFVCFKVQLTHGLSLADLEENAKGPFFTVLEQALPQIINNNTLVICVCVCVCVYVDLFVFAECNNN